MEIIQIKSPKLRKLILFSVDSLFQIDILTNGSLRFHWLYAITSETIHRKQRQIKQHKSPCSFVIELSDSSNSETLLFPELQEVIQVYLQSLIELINNLIELLVSFQEI